MNVRFNIEELFKKIPESNKQINARGTLGISNRLLGSADFNIIPRYERISNRTIDNKPFKILDAPGMMDDYYLNLLDWTEEDLVTIGLGDTVYTYNYQTKAVGDIFTGSSYISSIKSSKSIISLALSNGEIILYDTHRQTESCRFKQHDKRIASLAWSENLLYSGDKEGKIICRDIRTSEYLVLSGHTQEICGLSVSSDGIYLASGANDNNIRLWRSGHTVSRILKGHKSAVKALAWCPWKSATLTSGGGSKDKTIRFWNALDCKEEKVIKTESQVCTLTYLSKYKEIVTSHGYSNNDICLWKAGTMQKIASFGKHDSRVLHVALSPDNSVLASVSADENLKFWKLFSKEEKSLKRPSIDIR